MDKLAAESANLVSLINTNKSDSKTKGAPVEGDAFSKILERKTGKSEDTAEKTRESISNDKSDKAKEKTQQQADFEERLKARLSGKPGDMSMANYLYNIVLRSPDSLSMSEKQSFHVGDFSKEAVDVKEFQKMLGERGLNLRDLSMQQLAQLTQRTNKAQVVSFLDNLVSKQRDDKTVPGQQDVQNTSTAEPKKDEQQRKTVEARSAELRQPEQPVARDPQLNLVADAQRPQNTENASRKEEREKVIKQIIERMEIQTVGRRTELTMKLNPEYLGDMRVKLSTENGKLEAAFETTSREVRQFLEEGWEGLKDTFTRKGLNLQKVSATLVESLS